MKVYIVWCSNGYGNRAVVTVTTTAQKATALCNEYKHNQERYDNDYYFTIHEVIE